MGTMAALRVIKLGGSLLDWPEWPERFRQWLAAQPRSCNILIAGGGTLADEVRQSRFGRLDLIPRWPHWQAIDAMSVNIAAVRRSLSEAIPVDRWEYLHQQFADDSLVAFCPRDFLRRIEPSATGPRLPHSWDVTSDSIAARLVEVLPAKELVLLKSALPASEARSLQHAADAGYVDCCFPRFASGLPVIRCINLRNDELAGIFAA